MGIVKFDFGTPGVIKIHRDRWLTMHFAPKEVIQEIKDVETDLIFVYPLDRALLDLAKQYGGKASDIVMFVDPNDGERKIFLNEDLEYNRR